MRLKKVYGDTTKSFLAANNGSKPIIECAVKIFRFQYRVKKSTGWLSVLQVH